MNEVQRQSHHGKLRRLDFFSEDSTKGLDTILAASTSHTPSATLHMKHGRTLFSAASNPGSIGQRAVV